jgi:8-amino-7-oxononanoate synthase
MPPRIPDKLISAARERIERGSSRSLSELLEGIDICSNDYLGIARALGQPATLQSVLSAIQGPLGATGSRLVSGHRAAHEMLEQFLATFHRAETSLIFGSGYEANVGLLSSIATRTDTIFYDELVHASMRDGIRLSHARSYSFRHNDLNDLRQKLLQARGDRFIVVESLYSMDGDISPLEDLCTLAEESGAYLIVDEAHATGVYGLRGEGLVVQRSLDDRVFARIHTFGKAVGFRGACVVGPKALREHLINTARPFIYSTAPDAFSLAVTQKAYELMSAASAERAALQQLLDDWNIFRSKVSDLKFLPSHSPIQGIVVPGNQRVLQLEKHLRSHGFLVRAIRSPTVPAGEERLRVCLHSFNSLSDLTGAVQTILEHDMRGVAA